MLHEVATDAGTEPDALQAAYETLVRDAVTATDVDEVVAETKVDAETAESIADGTVPTLTVEEAASVIALTHDRDAAAIEAELRDHLLMGMTTAVLDVDTIAGAIDIDLTGQEVQQVLEGRTSMTLAQLAEIQGVIEARKR
ncbi:MAG: DUF5791 family protein [Halopenitus sp.]